MAASTSYNEIPSSSTSPPTLYDVFLSFRGLDTRNTFTSHLYKDLCRTGIRTFMDNSELRSGEVISDSLIQAIQESKTYIVVLSENYASSSWCLDELVEILNCYKTMKRLVIPVFCNIDSSVARHQTGSFKEAFGKHQTRFNMDKVNKWRLALREVAGFSGYPISENRSQADIIDKVVDRVLHEISPMTLDVAKYPVGLDSHVKSLTALFKNHKEGVIRIGIHGMGGVGKTTLAKAVYNQNYQRFQGSCFLANVREVSGMRNGLETLQQKLIADVLKHNINIGNVDQGIELIRARICSRKVLIVIDDLDDPRPLEYLQGSFALGSVVIITTRNEDLLDRINVKSKYKVNHLDKNESRQLFARHAFGNDKISGTFTELSKEILERAGGLPLALEVFGSNLLNQPEEEWRWFIDKLNRVPIDDIEKKLVISFDALKSIDPVLQNIFLDIACFYIGWKREEVSKIMETCYTFVRRNIDILRKRCLLTINDSDELGMHDLLRDMGMEIARNNSPDEPGKYSRLWDSNDIYGVLKNDKGTEAIQGIIFSELSYDHLHTRLVTEAIQGSISSKPMYANRHMELSFAAQSFRRMSKLRFLSLIRVHLSGSFKHIFEDLRWLHWTDCPSFCLPSDFHPEKLVILELPRSRMRMMFELHKASPVFEKLKILNMSNSLNLISTPDFSRLPCLETLDLRGCSSLAEVHISIGSLVRLVSLDLRGCRNLKRIPDSICSLRALEVLAITYCTNLIALPVEVGKVKSLKNLNAARLNISKLPDSVGLLGNVVELRLFQSKNLGTLPESISNLRSLEILDISDCMNLKEFPDQLGMITSLRELNARKATLLKRLPNLSNLKQLESLELTQCSALTEILGLEELNSLKILKLSGCNSSLVACTLTKRLLQIFSGFGHRMIIYIEPTGFPDWISRSSNSDFPSMASHDILAMIFCFKLSKYLYKIDYSVKNITSDFRWSESLSMPHGFDSVVMLIVPRSIFSIRDGDYGIELTSNLKIIHGIHLLYEPEITVVGESSSTTVNVEDGRCYPCKRLKHSESDKNWHSLRLSNYHEIPLMDGRYSVVGYLQQQIMDSSDDDSLVYEVIFDSTNVEELDESVEEMMSNSESEPNTGGVPLIDLTNEFSDKKNVSTVPTTTQQSPPVNLHTTEYVHLLDHQPLANIASEPAIQSTGTILDHTSDPLVGSLNAGSSFAPAVGTGLNNNFGTSSQNVANGMASTSVSIENPYPRTSTGIGTSNSYKVSGIDSQQELCDKVSYLECAETYKAQEMNTLRDHNKMLEARLARNKLQMDHMNHAYNSSLGHLLSRVNTLPSVVPGGTTIERGDVKNVLEHVLQDFAQNATTIEKLFGDREG